MTISLEASTLCGSAWSGVGFYTYYIIEEMTRLDAEQRFTLHFDQTDRQTAVKTLLARPNVSLCDRPGQRRYHAFLPFDLLRLRSRVYYSFNYRVKTPLPCPAAFTIYDCGWLLHPEYSPPGYAALHGPIMRRSTRRVALIFTISEAVKCEIAEVFDFDPRRIVVAPCAVAPPESEGQRPARLPDHPFFLMVNPGRRNKNWENALRGFQLYRQRHPSSPAKLVLAGSLRYEEEAIQRLIHELGLDTDVVLLGYVDDAALTYLYRRALLLLFPSWYEGFGIPVLEAMAHDLPVIVSDIPVFREVVGEAALMVPPAEPEAIATALANLSEDRALRASLVQRGRLRLENYSWQKSAQITLAALQTLAEGEK